MTYQSEPYAPCLWLAWLLFSCLFAPICEAVPDRLEVSYDHDTASVHQLRDLETGVQWLAESSRLWSTGADTALQANISIESTTEGEVELTLRLHNPSSQPIRTDITFPVLDHISGEDSGTLAYCFPKQDLRLGDQPVRLEETYSGRFPLQFVTAYQPGLGGIYLFTCDTEIHRKRYFLSKDDTISMGTRYLDQVIEPGDTLTLPTARLGVYSGDWHEALKAYRRWVSQWYQPQVPRKDWFRRVFNFRQVFLYPNLDTPGLYTPSDRSFTLQSAVDRDIEQFGAVDYVHVFDWSQTPDQGRVGMYAPWHHLPLETFVSEVEALQKRGIPVGLYFEGYLVSPSAKIPGRPGRDWQLRAADGSAYDPFGSGDDYLCAGVAPWRDHMTQAVRRTAEQTHADGYYIDQFGFGYQYTCYDPSHGHAVPGNQPRDETQMMQQIRADLPPHRVLYTEQAPVDVATQHQDGSFSYSLLHARHPDCPTRTNLLRFAFPAFKTIQILRGDGPIGNDVQGVKLALFNGEGLWLVGPSDNERWYSPAVLETIRRTHAIKRGYADAFTSTDVTPLVVTLQPDLYAHRYAGTNRTVWTLYNASEHDLNASVLRIPHTIGDRYIDLWNGGELQPEIQDDIAEIRMEILSGDIGCILQVQADGDARPDAAKP